MTSYTSKSAIKILFPLLLLIIPVILSSQIPNFMINDLDGNKYNISTNGKILTSGKPEFKYKTVSQDGLDYYLDQGIELIKSHYKIEGLILLKSIMAMTPSNDKIYQAQCRASEKINFLVKNEGVRFQEMNETASLLLFRENNFTILLNDNMLFSIRAPAVFKIINKRVKKTSRYLYEGVSAGIILKNEFPEKNNYDGYDILIAIDCEKFARNLLSPEEIESSWKNKNGADTFKRKIYMRNSSMIVYSFEDKYTPYYSGFDGYYCKNNYGYHLRIITSRDTYLSRISAISQIVDSFKIN